MAIFLHAPGELVKVELESDGEESERAAAFFTAPDVATANAMLRAHARLKPDESNVFDVAREFLGPCLHSVQNVFRNGAGERIPIQVSTDERKVLTEQCASELVSLLTDLYRKAQRLLIVGNADRKN